MAEPLPRGVWVWWAAFAGAAAMTLFVRLLPLGGEAGRWPGPDLVFCLACAWVLRRPEFVPALLVGLVVLVEDLLVMRPPGLWAALALLGTEFLRSRAALNRELGFMGEWLLVAVVISVAMLGYRVVLTVALVPQPGLLLSLIHLVGTLLAYPVVVAASWLVFGLHKPAAGEVDAMGRRL